MVAGETIDIPAWVSRYKYIDIPDAVFDISGARVLSPMSQDVVFNV